MTETATAEAPVEAEATVTATVEPAAPVVIPVPLDEFGEQAKSRLAGNIETYNALAKTVKAAKGDKQELLETLRDTSEDEQVKKITAAIEEIDNKREALWRKRDELLLPTLEAKMAEAAAGLGDSETRLTDLGKKISKARAYLADEYCPEVLHDLPALVGKRSAGTGAKGAKGASGNRRIRGFDFFVDGKRAVSRNGQGEETGSNAAAAAKTIGVDTEDIRQAFWAAAGTDDSAKYPAEVTFTVSSGEGDERKMFNVVAKRVEAEVFDLGRLNKTLGS